MINVTLAEAQEIMAERSNGSLEGTSAGKGGRAWLNGEWQLCELEALCVIIREVCREQNATPQGAEELISYWRASELAESQQNNDEDPDGFFHPGDKD